MTYSAEFQQLIRDIHKGSEGLPFYETWVNGHLGNLVQKKLARLIPLMERYSPLDGRKVLEFGSSSGGSAVAMAIRGAKVVAIEIDKKLYQATIMRAREHGVPIDALFLPDTRHLPFPPDSFDIVNCNAVLEHIRDDRKPYIVEMFPSVP